MVQEIEEVSGTPTDGSFLPSSPGCAVAIDGLAARRIALARSLWPGAQLQALDATHLSAEEAAPTSLAYPARLSHFHTAEGRCLVAPGRACVMHPGNSSHAHALAELRFARAQHRYPECSHPCLR